MAADVGWEQSGWLFGYSGLNSRAILSNIAFIPGVKLQRIRHLEAEIADMQKEIDKQKQKAVAANECLEKLMKEMG